MAPKVGRGTPQWIAVDAAPRGRLPAECPGGAGAAPFVLENLKKGGRIGGARALLGSMLSIKPVIEIRDGVVHEESKQRTRGKSLHYLAEKVTQAAAAGHVGELGVMHGDAPDIDRFIDMVTAAVGRDRTIVGLVGAVIGTHAGPGVVGVAWIEPK